MVKGVKHRNQAGSASSNGEAKVATSGANGRHSQAIRDYLAANPKAPASAVIAALGGAGITVSPDLVSVIKYKKPAKGRKAKGGMKIRRGWRQDERRGVTADQKSDARCGRLNAKWRLRRGRSRATHIRESYVAQNAWRRSALRVYLFAKGCPDSTQASGGRASSSDGSWQFTRPVVNVLNGLR